MSKRILKVSEILKKRSLNECEKILNQRVSRVEEILKRWSLKDQ